jgi:hypothetical protein
LRPCIQLDASISQHIYWLAFKILIFLQSCLKMTFRIYFSHFKLFKVEWGKEQKKLKVRYL